MKLYGGSRKSQRVETKTGKGGKAVKTIVIVLLVITVLGLGGKVAWDLLITPPDVVSKRPDTLKGRTTPKVMSGSASGIEGVDDGDPYRPNVYTVLLTGTYDDGNTDTIMVACVDVDNKKIDVVSIPRDTVVNVSRRIKKINGAYAAGGSNDEGMENLKGELEGILGFRPDYYAMVKMKGFKAMINAMDGIDFDVPVRMYKPSEGINLQAGMQHLDGDKALQLVRWRGYTSNNKAGVPHDDFGRMYIQQQFLKEVARQFLQLKTLTKIPEYAGIAIENIKPTDLSLKNMIWFAQTALGDIGTGNIEFHTFPTVSYQTQNGSYYENILVDEALEMINKTINPYKFDITEDMLDILLMNG